MDMSYLCGIHMCARVAELRIHDHGGAVIYDRDDAGALRDMASDLVRNRLPAAEDAGDRARGNVSAASDVRDLNQGPASAIETLRLGSMLDAAGGRYNGDVDLFGRWIEALRQRAGVLADRACPGASRASTVTGAR
jgi:hypothetical protein